MNSLVRLEHNGRGTKTEGKGVEGRNKRGVSVVVQEIDNRKTNLPDSGYNRLKTYKRRHLSKGNNLRFGMNVLAIVRRVRVDNHHSIDIVHVGEHGNARLVCDKQRQQKERQQYVSD